MNLEKAVFVAVLSVCLVASGGVAVFMGKTTVDGFSSPDPRRLAREPAVVESVSEKEIVVSYEDGLRTKTMQMREMPVVGERVLLERWNGDAVSVWDPVTERRFRAVAWNVRWSSDTFGGPLLMTALFTIGVVAIGIALVDGLRRDGI